VDDALLRRVPGEHAGKLACPFKTTVDSKGRRHFSVRKMQSNDWLHMAGPIGMYYVEMTDIHPRYKKAFIDMLNFLYGVRCRVLWRQELHDPARADGPLYDCTRSYQESAVILEYLLPINWNQVNQHVWQHAVSELVYAGPVYGHQMCPFEAGAGWLKSLLHSPKVPEEGLARAIASEWRSMLHKYDAADQDAIVKRLLAPKYRGMVPPIIDFIAKPKQLPVPKRTDTADAKRAIQDANKRELQYMHAYFLGNDDMCKVLQSEFELAYPGTWKQLDIKLWNVSDESFDAINTRLAARSFDTLTMSELRTVLQGPLESDVFVYTKMKVNDTVFCDTTTDGNFRTTNSLMRYWVQPDEVGADPKWTYATINNIYSVRPHALNRNAAYVTLFRVSNLRKPLEYFSNGEELHDSSELEPVTFMTDEDVIGSKQHLHLVPLTNMDDQNFAMWPQYSDEFQDRFFIVNINTVKQTPTSFA
jgi:hypothetical protein